MTLAGVASAAVVTVGGLAGGADEETDEELRTRLLLRIRQPPHGGAKHDYTQWALAAHPDVTRVWVLPHGMGLGTVIVWFATDDVATGPIPLPEVVAAVQTYIDGPAVRPVTAGVYVVAPVPAPLDLTIAGLSPATLAVREAVAAEILDLLRREAEPGGTILISHLREAISIAAGEWDHALVSPTADIAHGTGHMAVVGEITWS